MYKSRSGYNRVQQPIELYGKSGHHHTRRGVGYTITGVQEPIGLQQGTAADRVVWEVRTPPHPSGCRLHHHGCTRADRVTTGYSSRSSCMGSQDTTTPVGVYATPTLRAPLSGTFLQGRMSKTGAWSLGYTITGVQEPIGVQQPIGLQEGTTAD